MNITLTGLNVVSLHPEAILLAHWKHQFWLKAFLYSHGKSDYKCFWSAVITPSTWMARSCARPCTRTQKTMWLPWPRVSTGPGELTWEAWKVRGRLLIIKIAGLHAVTPRHTCRLMHAHAHSCRLMHHGCCCNSGASVFVWQQVGVVE